MERDVTSLYTGIAKARLLLMMINECDVIDLHFRWTNENSHLFYVKSRQIFAETVIFYLIYIIYCSPLIKILHLGPLLGY